MALAAVQRYLKQSPPPDGSEEMEVLKDAIKSFYTLIQVVDVEYGVGVNVFDVLRRDTYFVADIGLGSTAEAGAVFATRLCFLENQGFHVTGGAGLPVVGPTFERIEEVLGREFAPGTDFSQLTADQESNLAAVMIRACLATGMSKRIMYGASAEDSSRRIKPIDRREIRQANPNDPCPCGSGRKYKSCCRRRPRK